MTLNDKIQGAYKTVTNNLKAATATAATGLLLLTPNPNADAYAQTTPQDTTQTVQADTLQTSKSLDELCDTICKSEETGPQRVANILASQWREKPVLVDRLYNVPQTVDEDTLNIIAKNGDFELQGLSIREGEDLHIEFHDGQRWHRENLHALDPNSSLSLPNGARIENIGGEIKYITNMNTKQGTTSYTLNTFGENADASRFLTTHFLSDRSEEFEDVIADQNEQISIYRENIVRVKDERNQLASILNDKRNKLEAERQRADDYEEQLQQWEVKPGVGVTSNLEGDRGAQASLYANTPKGFGLLASYTPPIERFVGSTQVETREQAPANRGIEAELVRQTDTDTYQERHTAMGGLGMNVTEKFTAILMGGADYVTNTEKVTDKTFRVVNGETIDKQQDSKTFTENRWDPRVGFRILGSVGPVGIYGGATTDFNLESPGIEAGFKYRIKWGNNK